LKVCVILNPEFNDHMLPRLIWSRSFKWASIKFDFFLWLMTNWVMPLILKCTCLPCVLRISQPLLSSWDYLLDQVKLDLAPYSSKAYLLINFVLNPSFKKTHIHLPSGADFMQKSSWLDFLSAFYAREGNIYNSLCAFAKLLSKALTYHEIRSSLYKDIVNRMLASLL
jgi:hypothetical protein